MFVEWHDTSKVERVVESDYVTALCAAAAESASDSVAKLSAIMVPSNAGDNVNTASYSRSIVRQKVANDADELRDDATHGK